MKRKLVSRLALLGSAALITTLFQPVIAFADAFPPSEWVRGPRKRVVVITLEGQTTNTRLLNLLAELEERNAPVSFFFSGSWIAHHKNRARLVRIAGHALGNRGFTTERFTALSDEAIRSSIERAAKALRAVGAYPRPFLRPPEGQRDLRVLQVAGSLGYRSVRWSYRARAGSADRVKRRVVNQARPGAIISLDLWRNSHRRALPRIVDGLRKRGYGLRTIESLERVHAVRWDVTLGSGSSGPEVTYLQKALGAISYPAGPLTGSFGYETLQGVYAFEKVHKMARDGVVDPLEMERIAASGRPRTPRREPKDFIDVDVSRQVLFEVRDDKVVHTLPISSGNEEYYTVDGQTYKAHTPRGAWRVERKIPGWRESRLGRLYYPNYFVGGFAIHGSESVPTYPASHGCIRIPMYVAKPFYDRSPIGLPVFVHD